MAAGGGGRGGGGGGGGRGAVQPAGAAAAAAGAAGAGDGATVPASAAGASGRQRLDPSGMPAMPAGGPGVYPLHAAAGAEYGEGFAGNAHRHAPESWLAAVKYLIEELGGDVNARDDGGYTPLHHAAARGDNEVILYLVSKGANVKAVSRRGQTTADMANGPVLAHLAVSGEPSRCSMKLGVCEQQSVRELHPLAIVNSRTGYFQSGCRRRYCTSPPALKSSSTIAGSWPVSIDTPSPS